MATVPLNQAPVTPPTETVEQLTLKSLNGPAACHASKRWTRFARRFS
jgi:hypothetical protein